MIAQQGTHDGLAPPQPSDRLFLAVRPDADTAERIVDLVRRLREAHGVRRRPLEAARLHVTLQYFGAFAGLPQGLVVAIERAVDAIRLQAFEVAFGSVASFDSGARRRPWVLLGSEEDLAGLHRLNAVLGARLAAAGVRVAGHARFVPHLTLLYGDRPLPRQPIVPVAWTVRELVLLDSLIGQGAHQVLQRWPLQPA